MDDVADRTGSVEGASPSDRQRAGDGSPYVLRRRESERVTRSPHQSSSQTPARHSPYPQRRHTPPTRLIASTGSFSPTPAPETPRGVSASPVRTVHAALPVPLTPLVPGRLELRVQVLLKDNVNKHDKSAKKMTEYTASADSFTGIMQQLWDKYKPLVSTVAVSEDDGSWSTAPPSLDDWSQVMQFRHKRHYVEPERRVEWWNNWVASVRGHTVQLLIYKYGNAIVTNSQLAEFQRACIQPQEMDRSGAPSESVIREAVQELQHHWGRTYRAESMVWRMWAVKITSNRDRSTWAGLSQNPPPGTIARYLQPANSEIETRTATMNQSAKLALECVDAMLMQFSQLERDFAALANRFGVVKASLEARKATIEGFVRNVFPVPIDEIDDPVETMENVNDDEHEE